ncbi:helicase-related protein [Oxyplasma meridianum]|uniref:Helicase-related protein n=1 Tax=Oxyplasma meridianum TaxID=3073602 RepID=A0AAX4NHA0_9ARCH
MDQTLGGKIEPRDYQINVFRKAVLENTLVVLPTGMGKTVIAAMVANYILTERLGRVLFLAPTKPLVSQHFETFKKLLDLKPPDIAKFTGEVDNQDRILEWSTSKVVISTPQVVVNDMRSGMLNFSKYGLIIFDEAHRASGNYAYVNIAKEFVQYKKRLILALTASPGSKREKLDEVTENLSIENVIIKSENDPDVVKYVNQVRIDAKILDLPDSVKAARPFLLEIYSEILSKIRESGIFKNEPINRRTMAAKIPELVSKARNGESSLFGLIPYLSAAIRLDYAVEYLESQGTEIALDYINEIMTSDEKTLRRTAAMIKKSPAFGQLMDELQKSADKFHSNPKLKAILELCDNTLSENKDSRIIVFTHFRKTAVILTKYLSENSKLAKPVRFVGQSSKGEDEGINQKKQEEIIRGFREGEYNVLVATSVAEEGLDIPSTDLVIFYEPVPSDIRTIQRRGRTGRHHSGKVIILIYKDSRDSAYYYSSLRKESAMRKNISRFETENSRSDVREESASIKKDKMLSSLEDFF